MREEEGGGGCNTNRWEKGMRKRLIVGKGRGQLEGGKGGKRARQAGEREEKEGVTSRWQREKEGRQMVPEGGGDS